MYEKLIDLLENNSKHKEFDFLKITPEDLLQLGEKEGISNKSNLYFLMQESFFRYEDKKEYKEAAYLAHLISYYLYIIFTPINNYSLSLKYARKSLLYDKDEISYKEWILIFSESLHDYEITSYISQVLEKKPNSNLAKLITK